MHHAAGSDTRREAKFLFGYFGSSAAWQLGSLAARQLGSSAARQLGSSAARQLGSSAARQLGSSNTVGTSVIQWLRGPPSGSPPLGSSGTSGTHPPRCVLVMATDPSIPQTADVSAGPASPRPDTSRPDTSRPDTSRPDTSRPDTSRPDTSRPDTSRPDTSRPDTSLPDTSLPDTSLPDTSLPDTSLPDTSLPDTWRHDTSPASSGSAPLLPSAGTTERGIGRRTILRIASGRPPQEVDDDVAVEAPLEIRVAGEPVATTMRTPGDDHRLALGFLFAESVIKDVRDVSKVSHCGHPSDRGYGDTIDVSPGPGVALDPSRLMGARRGTLVTSACRRVWAGHHRGSRGPATRTERGARRCTRSLRRADDGPRGARPGAGCVRENWRGACGCASGFKGSVPGRR